MGLKDLRRDSFGEVHFMNKFSYSGNFSLIMKV
jgi:hypothetical protein